jgi:hypothetical protein
MVFARTPGARQGFRFRIGASDKRPEPTLENEVRKLALTDPGDRGNTEILSYDRDQIIQDGDDPVTGAL